MKITQTPLIAFFVAGLFFGLTPMRTVRAQSAPVVVRNRTTIPFMPLPFHGGPVIKVLINGTEEASFLLDTGSEWCYIKGDLADRLKLPRKRREATLDATGKEVRIDSVTLKKFKTGAFERDGVFLIMEGGFTSSLKVDGIVGLSALREMAVALDFEKQTCELIYPGKLTPEEIKEAGGDAAKGVALKPTDPAAEQSAFTIPAQLNGSKLELLIDTGSEVTTVTRRFNGKWSRESLGTTMIRDQDGDDTIELRPGVTIAVGEAILKDMVCGVSKRDSSPSALGVDFLSHFNVLFDFPARRLYLIPARNNPAQRANATHEWFGMTIAPDADGKWIVTAISEGKYRKAGVEVNDVIERVNGQYTDGIDAYELATMLAGNETLTLTIQRGKETQRRNIAVEASPKQRPAKSAA